MAIFRALRDQLSKYRRHKSSLDGHISGVDTPYHGSGQPALPYGHPNHAHTGHGTPQPVEVYDPIHAQYAWTSPEYDPPPHWFEGLIIPTPPPLRLDTVEFQVD